MNIIIIAAIGKNNELGKDNELLWHLKGDMKFFKEKTTGKTIVMGRNTFESLPKLLPNRKHIVITHKNLSVPDEVTVFNSLDETLNYIKSINEDVYIIGGGQIYKEFLEYANIMYLTEINKSFNADTYFPAFNESNWEKSIITENEENGLEYKHVQYTKRMEKNNGKR